MGWVSIQRNNQPTVYFGVEGEFLDICDLCNFPYRAESKHIVAEHSDEAGVIHYIWTCPDCACKNMR